MKRLVHFICMLLAFSYVSPLWASDSTWEDGHSNVKFEVDFPSVRTDGAANATQIFKEKKIYTQISFYGDFSKKIFYANFPEGEYEMVIPCLLAFIGEMNEPQRYGAALVSFVVRAGERTLVSLDYSNWTKHTLSVTDLPADVAQPRKMFAIAGWASYSGLYSHLVKVEDIDGEGVYLQPQTDYFYDLDESVVGFPRTYFVTSSTSNNIVVSLQNGYKKQTVTLSGNPVGLSHENVLLNYTDRDPFNEGGNVMPPSDGDDNYSGSRRFNTAGKSSLLVKEGLTLYLSLRAFSGAILESPLLTLGDIQADAEHPISLAHLRQVKFNVTGQMFDENSSINSMVLTIGEDGKDYYSYNGFRMSSIAYVCSGKSISYYTFTQNPKLEFRGQYMVSDAPTQEVNLSGDTYQKVTFDLTIPQEFGNPYIRVEGESVDNLMLPGTYSSDRGIWSVEGYLLPGKYDYAIMYLSKDSEESTIPVLVRPASFTVVSQAQTLSRVIDPAALRNLTVTVVDLPETVNPEESLLSFYMDGVGIGNLYNNGSAHPCLIEEGNYQGLMMFWEAGLSQKADIAVSSATNQEIEISFGKFRAIEVEIDVQGMKVQSGILIRDQQGVFVQGGSDGLLYLQEGIYEFVVFAEGFAAQKHEVRIGASNEKKIYTMVPDVSKIHIVFSVTDGIKNGQIQATVTIEGIDKSESTIVNKEGDMDLGAIFFNVPIANNPLTYTITAEGYMPLTKSIQLSSDQGGKLLNIEESLEKKPAGLQQPQKYTKCTLYPNPASTWMKIDGLSSVADLSVSTINGVLLLNAKVDNNEVINVSKLTPGFYIVTIKTVQGIESQTLLIQ